jgi:hypothetical protein
LSADDLAFVCFMSTVAANARTIATCSTAKAALTRGNRFTVQFCGMPPLNKKNGKTICGKFKSPVFQGKLNCARDSGRWQSVMDEFSNL